MDGAESWMVRALRAADGVDGAVVLSMLADALDDIPLLHVLHAAFGAISLDAPFLGSSGKVDKRGRVCADVVLPADDCVLKMQPLYESEITFRDAMRHLADRLDLTDHQRVAFFLLARKWIVCDYRLDPSMDPRDPDAKRLTEDGPSRLAH